MKKIIISIIIICIITISTIVGVNALFNEKKEFNPKLKEYYNNREELLSDVNRIGNEIKSYYKDDEKMKLKLNEIAETANEKMKQFPINENERIENELIDKINYTMDSLILSIATRADKNLVNTEKELDEKQKSDLQFLQDTIKDLKEGKISIQQATKSIDDRNIRR